MPYKEPGRKAAWTIRHNGMPAGPLAYVPAAESIPPPEDIPTAPRA